MRYPWPVAGPGRATRGRPTLQTSSNHHVLNRLTKTPVTNVVNPSPKTTIISEKALRLTTFVTTRPQPHSSDTAPPVWREPEGPEGQTAVPVGGGGAWPDDQWAADVTNVSTPGPTGVEGAGGTGGPDCSARGRRRGLAGQRADAPSHTSVHPAPLVWRAPEGPEGTGGLRDRPLRAAGSRVAISRAAGPDGARNTSGATSNNTRRGRLAGGPPPTGTHSGRALRRPKHPWDHKQPGPPPQHNETRPRPVARPRPRHAHAAPFTTAPPAIRRSCPRDPRPRRGQPRGGQRGHGTGSRTRSRHPRCGRSGSTAGRHRARHTRRA